MLESDTHPPSLPGLQLCMHTLVHAPTAHTKRDIAIDSDEIQKHHQDVLSKLIPTIVKNDNKKWICMQFTKIKINNLSRLLTTNETEIVNNNNNNNLSIGNIPG